MVFFGGGRVPKWHQQKLKMGTELGNALGHCQGRPWQRAREEEPVGVVTCYRQECVNYRLSPVFTSHTPDALTMCQALCWSLYIHILTCFRKPLQAVDNTSILILQAVVIPS